MFDFLGVSNKYFSHLPGENISDKKTRNPLWFKYLNFMKPILTKEIKDKAKNVSNKFLTRKPIKKPILTEETKNYIISNLKDDIKKLSDLLEIDFLNYWNFQ